MKVYVFFIAILFLTNCHSGKKITQQIRTIDMFRKIITGDFDNSEQIANELATGKQIHPLARHVNRIADSKIEGLPQTNSSNNFWIIEESYYEYPGKPMEIKPYLFNFSQGDNNTVNLRVYQFPADIKKEDIKNSNENLKLKFKELKPSPTFKGAVYTFHAADSSFTTNTAMDLGNGMRFTLTETMSKNKLVVMELVEKDGKRLTPYDTPIIYNRK